ncbi:MAG TPA: glycosyltransferase [Caulifigura sp.]|jgi:GT2 family glycosyltransferase|nr:glycosyltransferase [Caulifigura sp.]
MRATIVMAQYGQPQLTIACVQSLRRQHGDERPMIPVDDGSSPADLEQVARACLSNVELVCSPHRGVTAAWNAGAARASGDRLLFLNNDVITAGPWIDRMLQPVSDRRIVIAGVARRRERHVPAAVLERLSTSTFASGWCFAVRRRDFESVGGFRESLRLYFSDTDLQARLLLRHGCGREGIAISEGLPVKHLGHATTSGCPTRRAQWQADRQRFLELWGDTTA